MANDPTLRYMKLQIDGRLPRDCRTLTIPRNPIEVGPAVFVPHLIGQESSESLRVLHNWIIGNRHLFLYWCLTVEACEDIERAARKADISVVSFWLRRATRLINGSVSAFLNTTRMDQPPRSAALRLGLILTRAGFMFSLEYCRLMNALVRVTETMNTLTCASKTISAEIGQPRGAFEHAIQRWQKLLTSSNLNLKPTKRNQLEEIRADEGMTASFLKESNEVSIYSACDTLFGVVRQQSMFVEEFRQSLNNTLGAVRLDRTIEERLSAEQLSLLDRGNNLMSAMVDELTDPPSYHPEA